MATATAEPTRISTLDQLAAFADQVAERLHGWELQPLTPGVQLRCITPRVQLCDDLGGTLVITAHSRVTVGADRVTVTVLPPEHNDYQHRVRYERATITCAISRGPDAVAGDITRRVLAGYAEMVDSVAHQVDCEEALVREGEVLAAVVTGAMSGAASARSTHNSPCQVTHRPVLDGLQQQHQATVTRALTYRPGQPSQSRMAVNLDLRNLTGEQAIRVLTALRP